MDLHSRSIRLLFITLLIITLSSSTAIKKYLRPSQTFCFSEDMPKHTLYNITISAQYNPIRVEILQSRQVIQNRTITQGKFEHQQTTQKYGAFKFCTTNYHSSHQMVSFRFVFGVRAKDYSSHQEGQDYIRTLENQARIAQMFVSQIKQQNKQALILISETQKNKSKLSIQYYFTTIFIGIIGICTFIQYKTIRQHMMSRKYI